MEFKEPSLKSEELINYDWPAQVACLPAEPDWEGCKKCNKLKDMFPLSWLEMPFQVLFDHSAEHSVVHLKWPLNKKYQQYQLDASVVLNLNKGRIWVLIKSLHELSVGRPASGQVLENIEHRKHHGWTIDDCFLRNSDIDYDI